MSANSLATLGEDTLVVPHFRGKAVIDRAAYNRLCTPSMPQGDTIAMVRGLGIEMRQNIHRILPAAMFAEHIGAPLGAVEGWKGHEVRGDRKTEYVTGVAITRMILEMLQRRGLVSHTLTVHEKPFSRCTEEEAEAILTLLSEYNYKGVLSVTHTPNPSPRRSKATLERVVPPRFDVTVATPSQLITELVGRGIDITPEQASMVGASELTQGERIKGAFEESANITLDGLSETLHALGITKQQKLLVWLAHRKRKDRVDDGSEA